MRDIILYGAASIGELVYDRLKYKNEWNVIGFIDKRAEEIKRYCGLPVWNIEEAREKCSYNTVIFLAVKNVYEHENIAGELFRELGGKLIIYKPYVTLLGGGNDRDMILAKIYDLVFEGISIDGYTIPCYEEARNNLYDYAICEKADDFIVAHIPLEYVFTNIYSGQMEKWGDINVASFYTHISFFRYNMGHDDGDYKCYLRDYCEYTAQISGRIRITDAWRDNVIRNRIQIYEQMREASEIDPAFFVRNAATAEWNNQKLHFNLTSGKHRSTFLAAMGRRYIPLRITCADYEKFLNKKTVDSVFALLKEKKYDNAVPHPFFYRGPYTFDNGRYEVLLFLLYFFGKRTASICGRVDLHSIYVIDMLNDEGEYARFLQCVGCDVCRTKSNPDDLEVALNDLMQSNITYGNPFIHSNCKIVLILSECENDWPKNSSVLSMSSIEKYFLTVGYSVSNAKCLFHRSYYEDGESKAIELLLI